MDSGKARPFADFDHQRPREKTGYAFNPTAPFTMQMVMVAMGREFVELFMTGAFCFYHQPVLRQELECPKDGASVDSPVSDISKDRPRADWLGLRRQTMHDRCSRQGRAKPLLVGVFGDG